MSNFEFQVIFSFTSIHAQLVVWKAFPGKYEHFSWVMHCLSAVQSENQNFFVYKCCCNEWCAEFVVPRGTGATGACLHLSYVQWILPTVMCIRFLFCAVSNKVERGKTVTGMPAISHLFFRGCVQFMRKMECVLAHVVMITSLSVALSHIQRLMCSLWCYMFVPAPFFFFFFFLLERNVSGQLWRVGKLSR